MGQNNETRRTALVTGASRGIGRACAVLLAERGYDVCINYNGNEEAARETERLCKEAAPDAVTCIVQADVSKADGCKKLVEACIAALSRIDVLVNNAGITRDARFHKMTEEMFDEVIALDLKSAFLLTKEALNALIESGAGRVINISSGAGLKGNVGQTNYSAAKAGLIGMTRTMAKEVAASQITVNAIAPGPVETDMTAAMPDKIRDMMVARIPLGRIGKPEDIARAVCFLASEDASFITGQVLSVDGGLSA